MGDIVLWNNKLGLFDIFEDSHPNLNSNKAFLILSLGHLFIHTMPTKVRFTTLVHIEYVVENREIIPIYSSEALLSVQILLSYFGKYEWLIFQLDSVAALMRKRQWLDMFLKWIWVISRKKKINYYKNRACWSGVTSFLNPYKRLPCIL